MKKLNVAIMIMALVFTVSCKEKESDAMDENNMETEEVEMNEEMDNAEMDEKKSIVVPMGSKSESNVTGSIRFVEENGVVSMSANLTGLTAGTHAIHIHENGDCSAMDGSSAGGHWNPTSDEHGDWGDGSYHMGDIGNLEADGEGVAVLQFSTDKWCIGCDDETKNIVGKGVIVHATADDFTSQPSGAAGARVACGVIE
ncbi:superoxide dismutase [Nonlabens sp. YIK11]|uniref:superoxide dismutase family protein n=1 Tax=Nonlabens sp. YIK11 TaxID=1453349 RepID=UPI0006DC23EF|nr:superoxide dismutase family protein [Nonlabens sp. YIK11]KQC33441.1 superoxide dismutase [Nonlabens sp. YIK11]